MDTLFHNLSSFDICQENNIGLQYVQFTLLSHYNNNLICYHSVLRVY